MGMDRGLLGVPEWLELGWGVPQARCTKQLAHLCLGCVQSRDCTVTLGISVKARVRELTGT
jgi:hypothetical protein